MERKLRALAQRAQQNQHQRRQVQRVALHGSASVQHRVQIVAAHDVAQHQQACQQRQATGPGDGQRHARAPAGIAPVVPVADQKKGKQAGQLPEKRQLHQVARQHHAHHGAHESLQKGKKARHRVGGRHVVARIQHHQRPHAQDEHAKHPGKAVHADDQAQPVLRQPLNFLAQHAALRNVGVQPGGLRRADQCNQACQRGLGGACVGGQQGRQNAPEKGQGDEGDQGHGGVQI